MVREIRIGQDLSGQTLSGPSRQSFLRQCQIQGTKFVGDWRGTDYVDCVGAADWSQATTLASYWRGCDLTGSVFNRTVGYTHQDVVKAIFRQARGRYPADVWMKLEAVGDWLTQDYNVRSWDTSVTDNVWERDVDPELRQRRMIAMSEILEPYPNIKERFRRLIKSFLEGERLYQPKSQPWKKDLALPNGTVIDLDLTAVPFAQLPEPSRLAVANWFRNHFNIPQGMHLFIYTLLPLAVRVMPTANTWLTTPWEGY